MDFDDLNSKLTRMYGKLGVTYDADISSNIIDEIVEKENGMFEHTVRFGNSDSRVGESMVLDAIHAIASLKDIITKSLILKGLDKNSYEQFININPPLQLIIDIDNMDKHGNILKNRRYHEAVQIVNINQAIRGKGVTNISFTTSFDTGKTTLNKSSGNVKLVITGDIINTSNVIVAKLEDILESSVSMIENFISDNKLTNLNKS